MAALTDPSFKKRSSEGFDISRRDLCTLTGERWLNDQVPLTPPSRLISSLSSHLSPLTLSPRQVIQFYLALVAERSVSPAYREAGRPRVLAMSTFILQNLLKKSRVGIILTLDTFLMCLKNSNFQLI